MQKYYDIQKISCLFCRHLWILGSDKLITNKESLEWMKEALMEHEFIRQKREEENED